MTLFIQLLLAHLAGDFLLQPGSWVKRKEQRKWAAPVLYLHILIHFILIMLIRFEAAFWWQALVIAVSHLLIDGLKLQFQHESTKRVWFFADQALHLMILAIVAFYNGSQHISFSGLKDPSLLIVITAVVFLVQPAAVLIRMIISPWAPKEEGAEKKSLQNAGTLIGILERLLILVFIMAGKWEGVGFLLAAKSIFRFGDLNGSNDRKLTEYILIGTLISFTLAILTSMVAQYYFAQLHSK